MQKAAASSQYGDVKHLRCVIMIIKIECRSAGNLYRLYIDLQATVADPRVGYIALQLLY